MTIRVRSNHRWTICGLGASFVLCLIATAAAQKAAVEDGATIPPKSNGAADPAPRRIPVWVRDARWYEFDVPRFFNGERANDPPNTAGWFDFEDKVRAVRAGKETLSPPREHELSKSAFGGDLQGVRAKLGYLKDLGVNVLSLKNVWEPGELRPAASVSAAGADGEQVLIGFLHEAHRMGLRIVLDPVPSKSQDQPVDPAKESGILSSIRWMDPNQDGNPGDGVDGWFRPSSGCIPTTELELWEERVYKLNPDAMIFGGDIESQESQRKLRSGFLVDRLEMKTLAEILTGIYGSEKPVRESGSTLSLSPVSDYRSLSLCAGDAAALSAASGPDSRPSEGQIAQWRLAATLGYLLPSPPLTVSGDEVGMYGMGEIARAPMWWIDLPGAKEKLPDYREDFRELIKWLHSRREHYRPIREGSFRVVLADEPHQLFAFARTLPGDEVIVLINYGTEKRKAIVPTSLPGKMIGVLIPYVAAEKQKPKPGDPPDIRPATKDVFRVNGSRQFANDKGEINFWIGPKSARVIIANEKGPY